jgi:hypothetical protein
MPWDQAVSLLTTLTIMLITIGYCALVEVKMQRLQREEHQRELLLLLARLSKQQTRHTDALGVVLLRALRQGSVEPALLAEIRRDIEGVERAELPPGKPDDQDL